MPSLLLMVFLIELVIQLVNSVGTATIGDAVWALYTRIPSKRADVYAEHRKLQAEVLETRKMLRATSSQDEFAKWARLRRQHDKLLADMEKKKRCIDSDRRTFDKIVNIARIVLTRGPQYLLPFWYAREPMFWLPHGLFPGYAEWLLAFPRAPRGSVSIASWQLACTGVLMLLRDTLTAVAARLLTRKTETTPAPGQTRREKDMPVAADTTGISKKEL